MKSYFSSAEGVTQYVGSAILVNDPLVTQYVSKISVALKSIIST